MLKAAARLVLVLLMTVAFDAMPAVPVVADDGCQVYWFEDPVTHRLVSGVQCPGTPSKTPSPQSAVGGTAGCTNPFTGNSIPCTLHGAPWVAAWKCYVESLPNQPVDAAHAGMTAYECRWAASGSPMLGITPIYWARSTPAPVDPAVLAQEAVASMQLRAIRIGMVPDESPGSMGIVGVPAWLWVDAPDAQTFGPATSSASAGGVTVTARARVSKVVWSMGDGKAVTCTSAGTIFRSGDGGKKSPDCGYTYSKQGTYTIRATSTWAITWTATTGVTGTMALSFTSTRLLVVGEIQVLTR
jgi:hypothetical protein